MCIYRDELNTGFRICFNKLVQIGNKIQSIKDKAICAVHCWHLNQVAQTSAKLTPRQSNPGDQKYRSYYSGPVGLWSPKSSTFSSSNSNVSSEFGKGSATPD